MQGRRGLIIGIVVVGIIAVAGGFVGMIGRLMKSSDAYTEAMARAAADCRVERALGAPLEAGWFVSGTVETSGPSGHAELSIPVHGATAEGRLLVVARRSAEVWTLDLLQLEQEDGAPVDLLIPDPSCGNAGAAGPAAPASGKAGAPTETAPAATEPAPQPAAAGPAPRAKAPIAAPQQDAKP